MPGHVVPAHRRHGRMVLLRLGGRPETSNVNGVQNEHRADGVVVRVGARAHADRRLPGGTDTGHRVPVPVRLGGAQHGAAVSGGRRRNARLGRRGGVLRPKRRPPGQRGQPPHADAHRHHTDQQVSRRSCPDPPSPADRFHRRAP